MVGKILSGSEPFGCANYCLNHNHATPLYWQGLDIDILDAKRLVQAETDDERKAIARELTHYIDVSFRMQADLNPSVEKTVGHVALSFMKDDALMLNNARMAQIAREYMEMMGYQNTQYLVVRHYADGGNPHMHVFFNRVDNDGRRLNTFQDFKRNALVCRELTTKYGLHFSQGRANTRVERLHASERVRYQISNAIDAALPQCRDLHDLGRRLIMRGITMKEVRRNDGTLQGLRFGKTSDEDGHWYEFPGSKVGRKYSFKSIETSLCGKACNMGENHRHNGESHQQEQSYGCHESVAYTVASAMLSAGSSSVSHEHDLQEDLRRKKKKGIRR